VYCATTGDITLSGSSLNATGCTFVAQQGNIDIGGASLTTSGNFFANGANGSITVHGSNISLNGVLEATGANGQINITGAGINGNVTMIGTTLGLSGAGITLAPYPGYQNLTAYQTGTQLLKFSGAGYVSGGSIFAPNAAIDFSGAGNALGMLEAQDVSLHGAGYTFTGNGPPLAGTGMIATLVQ
jgi:hypothetical protein